MCFEDLLFEDLAQLIDTYNDPLRKCICHFSSCIFTFAFYLVKLLFDLHQPYAKMSFLLAKKAYFTNIDFL